MTCRVSKEGASMPRNGPFQVTLTASDQSSARMLGNFRRTGLPLRAVPIDVVPERPAAIPITE